MVGLSISNSIDITGRSYSKFDPKFIIEVDTSIAGVSNSDQFQFTGAVGEYDVEAYQNNNLVASFSDLVNEQTITLPSSGVYELRIIPKPNFDKFRFDAGGDKDKLLKVLQWGLYGVNEPDQTSAFYGCRNIQEIASVGAWFDVVTDGTRMFRSCFLEYIPDDMDFSVLIQGRGMFRENNFTKLPSAMKLPNLESGSLMFFTNNLTSLPDGMTLPNLSLNTGMFQNNNLTSLPSGMNLPLLGYAFRMFRDNNISDLPVGMELPSLTNGGEMFLGNTINTSRYSQLLIDLEANNPNNNVAFHGGNSQYNAQGQTARNALIARGWTITDGGLSEEFYFSIEVDTSIAGASNSDQFQFTGAVGNYDVEAYQSGNEVASFTSLVNEQTITLPSSGVYELRIIPKPNFDKFRFDNGGDKDKLLQILQWGLYGVNEPDQERAFFRCNLTSLPDGGAWFDVATDGFRMFAGNNLTSLPAGMELPNLNNGSRMFRNNSLTSLPASMELPLLTTGDFMFQSNNLTSLPASMELPLLTNGDFMFNGNNLTSLPASMELPNLTTGFIMFAGNNLTSLPAGMELPNLNNGSRMFRNNTINTTRYSQLLIDLEANNPNNNVNFHGGNSQYNAQGQIARNALIARGWTITDGGLE